MKQKIFSKSRSSLQVADILFFAQTTKVVFIMFSFTVCNFFFHSLITLLAGRANEANAKATFKVNVCFIP